MFRINSESFHQDVN